MTRRRDEGKGECRRPTVHRRKSVTLYMREKEGGRNSYNTLPSSHLSSVHNLSSSSFCLGFDFKFSARVPTGVFCVICVRELRAHRCSLFTFTTRMVSLLKFLPPMQAQPPPFSPLLSSFITLSSSRYSQPSGRR